MSRRSVAATLSLAVLMIVSALPATAQSFRVQCPTSTITHPITAGSSVNCSLTPTMAGCNNNEPAYTGPTTFTTVPVSGNTGGYVIPSGNVNGAIKCQQVSGGDGYSTMANGTQTFMFSFGPLSGLADIANGQAGTQFPYVFNTPYNVAVTGGTLVPGDPATTDGIVANTWPTSYPLSTSGFTWNGAVGLAPDIANLVTIYDIAQATDGSGTVYVQANAPLGLTTGSTVVIQGTGGAPPAGYDGTYTITAAPYAFPVTIPATVIPGVTNYGFAANYNFTFQISSTAALPDINQSSTAVATEVVGD